MCRISRDYSAEDWRLIYNSVWMCDHGKDLSGLTAGFAAAAAAGAGFAAADGAGAGAAAAGAGATVFSPSAGFPVQLLTRPVTLPLIPATSC